MRLLSPPVVCMLVLGAMAVAFSPPVCAFQTSSFLATSSLKHAHHIKRALACSVRPSVAKLSMVMLEENEEVAPQDRKKAVPKHIQDLLNEETTRESPLENLQTVDDFKGLETANMKKASLVKTELYVRGLPFSMSGKELRELFADYHPKYARVMRHAKYKDRSLGYGFVGFKTEAKAEVAMKGMEGFEVPAGDDDSNKVMTLRISYAQERGKKRMLSSRTGKRQYKNELEIRKAQLASRDLRNVAMTLDDMPRRWKALADVKALDSSLTPSEGAETGELDDDRAERAVQEYLTLHSIEDIAAEKLAGEAAEALEGGDEAMQMLYGVEEDDDEEDWKFVAEGEEEEKKLEDFIEDEEEERRNWEEYQKMQRMNKQNLREESDAKPSGALRSGQKKPKTWTRDE